MQRSCSCSHRSFWSRGHHLQICGSGSISASFCFLASISKSAGKNAEEFSSVSGSEEILHSMQGHKLLKAALMRSHGSASAASSSPSPGEQHHQQYLLSSVKARVPSNSNITSNSHDASASASSSNNMAPSRLSSKKASPPLACLCSPTAHAGSFRCRFHRGIMAKQAAARGTPSPVNSAAIALASSGGAASCCPSASGNNSSTSHTNMTQKLARRVLSTVPRSATKSSGRSSYAARQSRLSRTFVADHSQSEEPIGPEKSPTTATAELLSQHNGQDL